MPSFWTSDAPLAQIRVCIQPAEDSTATICANNNDATRKLAVPLDVYNELQQSLIQRQKIDGRAPANESAQKDQLYVSVSVVGQSARTPCVMAVGKDPVGRQPAGAAVPICVASNTAWLAIEDDANGLQMDDATPASVSAVLEGIVPIELTEVVLGVSSSQYDDALAAQDQISAHINSQTRLYYRGFSTTAIVGDAGEPISLQCLMCQPVSQGVIRSDSGGAAPRIIIVKTKSPAASGTQDAHLLLEEQSGSEFDAEQWDLGAEWLILGNAPLAHNAKNTEISAVELDSPIDHAKLVPAAYAGEDLDNRGYMSLASLAKLGIVSGGWVLIAPSPAAKPANDSNNDNTALPSSSQRAIRVFGWDGAGLSDQVLALPPILLCNICFSPSPSYKPSSGSKLLITPLGLPPASPSPIYLSGAADTGSVSKTMPQPPLETARKVVLARVSSPLSEQIDMETHALAALQQWMSPSTSDNMQGEVAPLRVVKTGDLISVRISLEEASMRTTIALVAGADAANRLRSGETDMDPISVDVNPVTDLALEVRVEHDFCAPVSGANELVFYKVVSAEGFKRGRAAYGLQSIITSDDDDEYGVSSDSDSNGSGSDDDGYDLVRSASKSLDPLDRTWAQWYGRVRDRGLVIRPDVTMVVQTGAVHSRAPYRSVRGYLRAGKYGRSFSVHTQESAETAAECVPYFRELDQLMRLANASLHPLAISRKLICSALLMGNPGTGKRLLVHSAAERLGIHLYELSCYDILAESEDKTAQVLEVYFQNASRYTPCILHLRSIEALAQASNAAPGQENADDLPISRVLRKCIEGISRAHQETGFPIVVVASSNQSDKVPTSLAAAFHYEINLNVPDECTRLLLLKNITASSLPLAPDADVSYVAQQTASFVARDLATLIRRAESHAWRRARSNMTAAVSKSLDAGGCPLQTRDLLLSGQIITNDDLLNALGDARASMSDTLGVPKIPNVKWDDVGGLADAKKDILDTIRLPMEQPHLFASGLSTRSGLLFYGPPGTGKTLLAKAIATECGLNFFSCKGPELISPYIGESEANVRRIFQKAREASPCVIFFDELDSLAPKRGQQGDSGGVMDRIVSQLLAELDGMSSSGSTDDIDENAGGDTGDQGSKKSRDGESGSATASAVQVFAIGATNRPDLLDPALLRPGRFDKLVYLGVSETHEAQLNIIQALTRKFQLHSDLDLHAVAEECPFHYTGADFYALCSDALLKAMLRTVDNVDALVRQWNEDDDREPNEDHPVPMTPQYYLDQIAPEDIKQVTVTMDDFEKALDELIPSVSADELVRYQVLRRQFDSVLKGKDKDKDKQNQHTDEGSMASTSYAETAKGKGKDPAN
ncbi:peroxisomal assembly protein [Kickxella alabastrina]|nr:peroxisomal assembly protein [Kickxella alabastrina]